MSIPSSETIEATSNIHIGVDVGGTNTDAVALVGRRVMAAVKTPTTGDVVSGVLRALELLISEARLSPEDVRAVMIGTTQFTNAVVEARDLEPTAVLRLCGTATKALPPFVDWPARLRNKVEGKVFFLSGGHEYDGREIAQMDPEELKEIADAIRDEGLRSVAITSVFSPVNDRHEREAAAFLTSQLPDLAVSLSSEIGRIGLLERENATIINACLQPLAARIVSGFTTAVDRFGIKAPLYLSQNDGTLMDADYTRRYPVATFASGPTNSMRGAAHLSGETDCAVIDVGGTTTDIGILRNGFPREASLTVEIGGVRTNFRMPDVLSLGIGGGSLVHTEGELRVGPESVGHRITQQALVFGGDTLTATDVAVAAGLAEIGDPSLVRHLDRGLVDDVLDWIHVRVAEALDQMKSGPDPIPVVLVGGGSILLRDSLPGAAHVRRPDHFPVANAIGAGIAQVGGLVDRIVALDRVTREEALVTARREAEQRCIDAGAIPGTVRVVDVEEIPLAYLPSNAVRIRVRAVGELIEETDANPE